MLLGKDAEAAVLFGYRIFEMIPCRQFVGHECDGIRFFPLPVLRCDGVCLRRREVAGRTSGRFDDGTVGQGERERLTCQVCIGFYEERDFIVFNDRFALEERRLGKGACQDVGFRVRQLVAQATGR